MASTKRDADGGDADLAALRGSRLPKNRMRKNDAAGMSGMIQACSSTVPAQPFIESTSSRSTLGRLR